MIHYTTDWLSMIRHNTLSLIKTVGNRHNTHLGTCHLPSFDSAGSRQYLQHKSNRTLSWLITLKKHTTHYLVCAMGVHLIIGHVVLFTQPRRGILPDLLLWAETHQIYANSDLPPAGKHFTFEAFLCILSINSQPASPSFRGFVSGSPYVEPAALFSLTAQ